MAKVIFLHLSVIHSVHRGGRGSASVHAGIPPPPPHPTRSRPPRTRQTPSRPGRPPREQTPTHPRPGRPPPGSRLQHTVNKRPVRILLECILVTTTFIIYKNAKARYWRSLWTGLCVRCRSRTQPVQTIIFGIFEHVPLYQRSGSSFTTIHSCLKKIPLESFLAAIVCDIFVIVVLVIFYICHQTRVYFTEVIYCNIELCRLRNMN